MHVNAQINTGLKRQQKHTYISSFEQFTLSKAGMVNILLHILLHIVYE